jgi:hypothetical protein
MPLKPAKSNPGGFFIAPHNNLTFTNTTRYGSPWRVFLWHSLPNEQKKK